MHTPPPDPRPASTLRKRILIVDDHPLMREGIVGWINRAPDLEVCGTADSSMTAVRLLEKLEPDLVVTDLSLPERNGFELIKDVHALRPHIPVLVLSMHSETFYAQRALRAGASGFLMKSEGGEKLVAAIRRILAGGIEMNDRVVQQVLASLAGRRPSGASAGIDRLTDRELEIFELIGQGKDVGAIATALHVSPKTVNVHQNNIREKLGVASANALIHLAVLWLEAEHGGSNSPFGRRTKPPPGPAG